MGTENTSLRSTKELHILREEATPLEIMPELAGHTQELFLEVVEGADSQFSGLLGNLFKLEDNALVKSLKAALQLDSLTAINSLWTAGARSDTRFFVLKHNERIIKEHLIEKMTDDLGILNVDTGEFTFAEEQLKFNHLAVELIEGNLTQEQALMQASFNLKDADTQLRRAINDFRQFLPFIGQHSRNFPSGLIENPNEVFAKLNLKVIGEAAQALRALQFANHDGSDLNLDELMQFGLRGLQGRYIAGNFLIYRPSMAIQEARGVGQASILTNYTFTAVIGAMASGNIDLRTRLAPRQSDVQAAICNASQMIRDLNDAGATLELTPDSIAADIEQLRERFGYNLYPRELFALLAAADENSSISRRWRRIVKDAEEFEYNMLLNHKTKGKQTSLQEAWTNLTEAQTYLNSHHAATREELTAQLQSLMSDLPEIAYILGSFVDFNRRLYAEEGTDKKSRNQAKSYLGRGWIASLTKSLSLVPALGRLIWHMRSTGTTVAATPKRELAQAFGDYDTIVDWERIANMTDKNAWKQMFGIVG
jgi:hypothetical protein